MNGSEQKSLKRIWLESHPEYKLLPLQWQDFMKAVKLWLQQKLDAMPKGEWGEKSMLLELLDELGAYKK